MTKAEEILKETLDLDGEITKRHYTMTLKVRDAIEAINKALSITAVVQAKPEKSFRCSADIIDHKEKCSVPCPYCKEHL